MKRRPHPLFMFGCVLAFSSCGGVTTSGPGIGAVAGGGPGASNAAGGDGGGGMGSSGATGGGTGATSSSEAGAGGQVTGTCKAADSACGGHFECCDGTCYHGVCARPGCLQLYGSSLPARCTTVDDCCNVAPPEQVICFQGYCTNPPVTTDGGSCLPRSLPCSGDSECCSGHCDGALSVAPGTCRQSACRWDLEKCGPTFGPCCDGLDCKGDDGSGNGICGPCTQ